MHIFKLILIRGRGQTRRQCKTCQGPSNKYNIGLRSSSTNSYRQFEDIPMGTSATLVAEINRSTVIQIMLPLNDHRITICMHLFEPNQYFSKACSKGKMHLNEPSLIHGRIYTMQFYSLTITHKVALIRAGHQ